MLLFGCTTTGPSTVSDMSRPEEHFFTAENQVEIKSPGKIHSLPKALDTKPLPEATPAELEQSGDLMFMRDNLPMAYVNYEKCLELDPENLNVRYKKGLVLLAAGMSQDAVKVFEGILETNENFELAYEGLGRARFQARNYLEAEEYFKKALEINPDLWRSHSYLGMIYDYGQMYDEAVDQYLAAVRLKPEYGIIYHNLSVSYYLSGRHRSAINSFLRAIANGHTKPKTYNTLGLAYAKSGQYQQALDAFTKAGDKAKAYNNLGCFFMAKEEYKSAINSFEKALEISPEFYATASENLRLARAAYHRNK